MYSQRKDKEMQDGLRLSIKKKPTKYKPYVTLGNFTFSFYSIFICKKFFKYSLYKKLVIMRTETSIVNMQDWSLHTIILVAVITTTWGLSYYFSFGDKKPEHKSLKEYMPLYSLVGNLF